MSFAAVPDLLAELCAGRPVVLLDDAGRENEGDVVLPAECVTPEWLNFMVREARGLVCVSVSPERALSLSLPPMAVHNADAHGTAFTVSVDHAAVGTGISAADRARTVRALADAPAADFRRPGHVFPLVARPGGVLARPGHTEAAFDLARLAGFSGAAAICEILNDDGTMARAADLEVFCGRHGLKLGRVADLVAYRRAAADATTAVTGATNGATNAAELQRGAEAELPTPYGPFRVVGFTDVRTGAEHVALVRGELGDVSGDDAGREPPLVRVHSECLTGDVFGSLRCDCGPQLEAALRAVGEAGRGLVLYLRQEGRGVGLAAKLRAYALQDGGLDTVAANEHLGLPADARDYSVAARILEQLGVRRVRLLTNNPEKLAQLAAHGVGIAERVPLVAGRNPYNAGYLDTKARRLGHLLPEGVER